MDRRDEDGRLTPSRVVREGAEPTTLHTLVTSSFLRRSLALAMATFLLFLIHPLPAEPSPDPDDMSLASNSISVILPTLFATYHLAPYESSMRLWGRAIGLKWLLPGLGIVIALAARMEDGLLRYYMLWNCVIVLWFCGWKAMSSGQIWFLFSTVGIAVGVVQLVARMD